jgi:hypothetical protein
MLALLIRLNIWSLLGVAAEALVTILVVVVARVAY